jgi:tRNA U34 5-methylaminomethyl-2-thiouridine-forming methyltransferase MnmC
MTNPFQHADLDWRDGIIPVSRQFDDPYFSLSGGLSESRHVFLQGNRLPERFTPNFHIAELGFGTGLNLIAALIAWRASGTPGKLTFTSFEAFPMAPADTLRALHHFPEALATAQPLLDQFPTGRIIAPDLDAHIIHGDARRTLPPWPHKADAWFLDGFSPAKNPELWGADLMQHVAAHTAPNGTFATYTAAGHVRQSLATAGFAVQRQPGYAHKRHMTAGYLP